jgi:hypothetical protein
VSPQRVMTLETKEAFKSNIINLMTSVDPKIVPTIKEMIVAICKEGGGYANSWPDLMKVKTRTLISLYSSLPPFS